ncbi:MAG: hypothetical protein EPO40_29275 [Myxococcaceae bacterium]|nr:MAG: hypothetical protein EPO40_29275 [Myxococcaceae bacterium]
MRALRVLLLTLLPLCSAGCAATRASAIPTSSELLPYHRGAVTVRALSDPPGARELGAVEASGEGSLDAVVEAFVEQVRGLGGNVARIDSVTPVVETRMRQVSQAMPCFGMRFQAGCSQSYLTPEEVPVVRLVGRALRVDAP